MKKKIKLSDSEKKLLLIFLSLLFVAAAYFLVFQRNMAKAQEIEAANIEAAAKVLQLEAMVARQAQVEEQTAECLQTVDDIIAKYPSDVTTEKAIAFIQDLENATGMKVTDINFLMNNLVGVVTAVQTPAPAPAADTDTAADGSDLNAADAAASDTAAADASASAAEVDTALQGNVPAGYYATVSMSYQTSYQGLKDIVKYITSQKDRMTIPAITVSYDETTGGLSGVLTVNMYYLTNTGREYEPPTVRGINRGVTDIFRSSGIGVPSQGADVSGENGGEENEEGEGENEEGEGDAAGNPLE